MHKSLFFFFLRNINILHLNWIHSYLLLIGNVRFRSIFLNCQWWSFSCLRKCNVMHIWFIIWCCFLRNKILFCIFRESGIRKSCICFWIFNSLTNSVFITRIGSQIYVIPETLDLHTASWISIESNWLTLECNLDVFFSTSRENIE